MRFHSLKLSLITCILMLLTSCKKEENPNAPMACFEISDVIEAGVAATFNSSCSENAVSFSWTFGDGGVSIEANPDYTFSQEGTYDVTLSVADALGDSDDVTQTVTVLAPSVIEHSGRITEDETWIEATHLITNDVYIDGATLTIEPGAVIQFSAGSGLYFGYYTSTSGAILLANGTAGKPITFTSAASTKSAGDWDYIGFFEGASSASSMQYCIIEYGGGYNDNYGSVHLSESSVSIENSTLRYSGSMGISLDNAAFFESFDDNTLQENDSYPVSIYGNFAHSIGTGNNIATSQGILVRGDDLEQADATWQKQTCPFIISGTLYIGSVTAAKLTLAPGLELAMGNGASIYVGYHTGTFGTLIAEGNSSEHIKITSSSPAGSKSPGDWDFIGFYDGAGSSSSLSYVDVEYGGGYNDNYGMVYVDGSIVSIAHSKISNSQYIGVSLRNDASFKDFNNNTFEGNGDYPVEIYSNAAHTMGSNNTYLSGPGILLQNDDIEQSNVTWVNQGTPFILTGNHYLGSTGGSTLTIEPGTTLKFTSGAALYVGYRSNTAGNLIADGDPGNMITFTSGAAPGFETAGDWDGIWFYDGTGGGTLLDYCMISYGGGYTANSGNLNIKNDVAGIPEISNCQIENSGAYGIWVDNGASPTLTDNTFANNASGDVNP